MTDERVTVADLATEFAELKNSLGLDAMRARLAELEAASTDPTLWDNQNMAKQVMQELGDLKSELEEIDTLSADINSLVELSALTGMEKDVAAETQEVEKRLAKFRLAKFLSGKYDKKNAIVTIHAGQGGTEAMDWTSMLLRMYTRFCEKRGWASDILDITSGEEAGIKSVSFEVTGQYAYGYLKNESGTHRLVRQSPFNADKLRQTSFASVEVVPELASVDIPEIEVKDEDLDWQFYRSSGKGGQNVNKVSTAVRLIHKPTGITVTAQTERSQEQNRDNALNLLRGKLWVAMQESQAKELSDIRGDYRPPSWGTQIRSYVLHPYKMVKDLRTGVETSDSDAVLDGGLDDFVAEEIKL